MQAWRQVWAKERWAGFCVWLECGRSGISPLTLRLTLGPVAAWLPQARQVAGSLQTWLLAALAERQRRGLGRRVGSYQEEADVLEADSSQQPYKQQEMERQERWLRWGLAAELLRLVRLAEAPEETMRRPDWLAWEVRYWALAVSLTRVGQVYVALEERLGRAAATETLNEALAVAWRQAIDTKQAA